MTDAPIHTIELAANGNLTLGCPTIDGHVSYIELPPTEAGARTIRKILQAFAMRGDTRIATASAPIQYDINAMLKSFTKAPERVNVNGKIVDLSELEL